MKLFTSSELKDLRAKDQAKEVLRTQEIEKVADKARKNMATAELDFKTSLAKFKDKWAEEEQAHTERVREMSSELYMLEERKKEALVPLTLLEEKIEKKLKEAEDLKSQLRGEHQVIEELREVLENKLDDMAEKNKRIDDIEVSLTNRERGIKMQETNTAQNSKELSKQMTSFFEEKTKSEKDIKERKKTLFLKERSLLSKEESLKRTEKSLAQWAITLKDERGVLDRIYKRKP